MRGELEALRRWVGPEEWPEGHRPVKSVNEQLHIEKESLFQMVFEVLAAQLQRQPASIPVVRHLYFEHVFKKMNPEFVAQYEQQQNLGEFPECR
jgi:hypothetical protein